MFKSFFKAMNMCMGNDEKPKIKECKVDELEDIYTPTGTKGSTINPYNTEHLFTLKNKDITFNVNTFGPNEDDLLPLEKFINSPKFNEPFELMHTNSNKTMLISKMESFNLPSSSQQFSEDESSSRIFIKEKLAFLKERRASLLFTIKDPNLEDEMPEKVFSMNNIIILDSEIAQSKKLTLEDELGQLLFNQFLVVDASGLVNSLRKRRDGYVFFGPVAEYKNCIINDFVLNYDKELCKTRLFVIFYERNHQKYFIRNLNDEEDNQNLIYIKLTKQFPIKKKVFFSFGQIVISAGPVGTSKINSNTPIEKCVINEHLKIVVYIRFKDKLDKENKLTYYFNSSNSPIHVGRSHCSITLDYNSLSKKQCTFIYNSSEQSWEITDGYNNRPSTNGTWLMITSKYELKEKTFVKIGNNVIKINLV